MTLPSKKMELQLAINSLTTETFEQLLRLWFQFYGVGGKLKPINCYLFEPRHFDALSFVAYVFGFSGVGNLHLASTRA
jgi:hypothetical protein